MTIEEIYEKFLGHYVSIGIPNFNDPCRLFFVKGNVISVSDGFITLQKKNCSIKKIPYSDILEIAFCQEV